MRYTSYAEIPNDLLDGMIALFELKAPAPPLDRSLTGEKLPEFNWHAGRHSILRELRDEREQRTRKAVKGG